MKQPRCVDGVTQRTMPDGDSVVLAADGSQALVINALGSVILSLCDGARSTDNIVDVVHERFVDVARQTIAHDVGALLLALQEAGVLEDVCGNAP